VQLLEPVDPSGQLPHGEGPSLPAISPDGTTFYSAYIRNYFILDLHQCGENDSRIACFPMALIRSVVFVNQRKDRRPDRQ
jgi:hypothetical protein